MPPAVAYYRVIDRAAAALQPRHRGAAGRPRPLRRDKRLRTHQRVRRGSLRQGSRCARAAAAPRPRPRGSPLTTLPGDRRQARPALASQRFSNRGFEKRQELFWTDGWTLLLGNNSTGSKAEVNSAPPPIHVWPGTCSNSDRGFPCRGASRRRSCPGAALRPPRARSAQMDSSTLRGAMAENG